MLNQYRDVFRCLNSHDVRYLVIGGVAAILHGVPRATFDLDILIDPTPENAQRLLDGLLEARLGTAALTTAEKVLRNEITILNDRLRIDIQTRTPGIEFESAWAGRDILQHGDEPFFVVNRADLIASKLACGRDIDLADVRALQSSEKT